MNQSFRLWAASRSLVRLRKNRSALVDIVSEAPRPVPVHLKDGASGVCRDLETLGVVGAMRTGKIDVPDIYRLGFRLRRHGGVPPRERRA